MTIELTEDPHYRGEVTKKNSDRLEDGKIFPDQLRHLPTWTVLSVVVSVVSFAQ